MRYLGGISGRGALMSNGIKIGRASYDFDGFFEPPIGVTSCGEIRLAFPALKTVFGRTDVQLLTDDGHLLDLRFSYWESPPTRGAAHVEVTGDLPATPQNWRH
jgi:hypothetical protein